MANIHYQDLLNLEPDDIVFVKLTTIEQKIEKLKRSKNPADKLKLKTLVEIAEMQYEAYPCLKRLLMYALKQYPKFTLEVLSRLKMSPMDNSDIFDYASMTVSEITSIFSANENLSNQIFLVLNDESFILSDIDDYHPATEKRKKLKKLIYDYVSSLNNIFSDDTDLDDVKKNSFVHITLSPIVLNSTHNQIMLVYNYEEEDYTLPEYHMIAGMYDSIGYLKAALRRDFFIENCNEITDKVISINLLPVKRSKNHFHINICYLFELGEATRVYKRSTFKKYGSANWFSREKFSENKLKRLKYFKNILTDLKLTKF